MNHRHVITLLVCSFFALFVIPSCSALAVLSIDLGSEWIKVAVVSPGVPMEIALNKESKRKTPTVLGFRGDEVTFGDDALAAGIRNPATTYIYLLSLLGKTVDQPKVKAFQEHFPHYNITADPERGTVIFNNDDGSQYSVEEIVGIILERSKEIAETHLGQPVQGAVITVPPYFNQAERKALLSAAELGNVKVLQLMNNNVAAALNYGLFWHKNYTTKQAKYLFFDMGAHDTIVTVVGKSLAQIRDRGILETHPQISVLGVGYDHKLGGLEMQIRLRDHLGHEFDKTKKASQSVFKNARAMAKLLKEAGRVKNVLSANTDHFAQVEGLLEEKDMRIRVTREELEQMCADLYERISIPVNDALSAAQTTMDEIDAVLLVGAGTRVPKVQEVLQAVTGKELGKNLNTDEAIAIGAVYKAADLSTGFRVKKYITKDSVIFPIQVEFERDTDNIEKTGSRTQKRVLFAAGHPFPQKKILTFNKRFHDFSFYVNYGDTVPKLLSLSSPNITKVDVTGIEKVLAKHLPATGSDASPSVEYKGIKAHFSMDDSGILSLGTIEAVFEREKSAEEKKEESGGDLESTLSRLGSTISKLFTGSSDNAEKDETAGEKDKGEASEIPAEEAPPATNQSDTTANVTDGADSNGTSATNTTDDNSTSTTTTTTGKDQKKIVVIKEPLVYEEHRLDLKQMSGDAFKAAQKRIQRLNELDKQRQMRERAKNNLEGFVLDLQGKLYSEEYEKASTEEERAKITEKCTELSDWLYEDGSEAETTDYDSRLEALKSLAGPLLDRVKEHQGRPEALKALKEMLNSTKAFYQQAVNVSKAEKLFSEVELNSLKKLISDTEAWRDQKVKDQKAQSLTELPKLTIRSIGEKIGQLDRDVKYLLNKAKIASMERMREEEKKAKEKILKETEAKLKESLEKDTLNVSKAEAEVEEDATKNETEEGGAAEEEVISLEGGESKTTNKTATSSGEEELRPSTADDTATSAGQPQNETESSNTTSHEEL